MSAYEMAVGELGTMKKGSGARANGGKPQLDLIPVRQWMYVWFDDVYPATVLDEADLKWYHGLAALRDFQEGDDHAIRNKLKWMRPYRMAEAVEALEYGATKYDAWNWATGMKWSIPTGCALRHAQAWLEKREEIDAESGCTHWGLFLCNILMLDWFVEQHPDLDDRPPIYTGEQ